jgi:hypothetical protein
MTTDFLELNFDPGQINCGFIAVGYRNGTRSEKSKDSMQRLENPHNYEFWTPHVFDFTKEDDAYPKKGLSLDENKKGNKSLELNTILVNVHTQLVSFWFIKDILKYYEENEKDGHFDLEVSIENQEGLSLVPNKNNMFLANQMIRMNAIAAAIAVFFICKGIPVRMVGKNAKWKTAIDASNKKKGKVQKREHRKAENVSYLKHLLSKGTRNSVPEVRRSSARIMRWIEKNNKIANHVADSALQGMHRLKHRIRDRLTKKNKN